MRHLRSDEIRESDSGVPGRTDFLEPYRDHGIMWALNAWWRARQRGPDLYLAFETVTLARSVQEFSCKLGLVPIPKSIIAGVMDSFPAEALELSCRRPGRNANAGLRGVPQRCPSNDRGAHLRACGPAVFPGGRAGSFPHPHRGGENIPARGPALLVANHVSFADAFPSASASGRWSGSSYGARIITRSC